jgi:hypothetical protein
VGQQEIVLIARDDQGTEAALKRLLNHLANQSRFPDPGLANEQACLAAPSLRLLKPPFEGGKLFRSPDERW